MQQLQNFSDIRAALKKFMPSPKEYEKARFSLDDMKLLLSFLGNPQDKIYVIHVAGTSGKTSTCYYLAAMLMDAGKTVGLTVSPHVDEVNERVQINLKPLDEHVFASELSIFLELVDKSPVKPSYFAVIVAFVYWYFAKIGVDYAVVEVGMGGLLDATNVVSRVDKVCVITDIGLDHTEFLGDTLAKIAAQKAGIIQKNNPVFCYEQGKDVMRVIAETCKKQSAQLHIVRQPESIPAVDHMPDFQKRNFYLASQVFDYICDRDKGLAVKDYDAAKVQNTYIPARMETITVNGKTLILDGAHNAHKLMALFESIRAKYGDKPIAVLFGVAKTSGIRTESSVEVVARYSKFIVLTSFYGEQDVPKESEDPLVVSRELDRLKFNNYQIIRNPEEAFELLKKRPEDILVVAGSFYLLNHIRPLIKEKLK